jgi:hypothetical protein
MRLMRFDQIDEIDRLDKTWGHGDKGRGDKARGEGRKGECMNRIITLQCLKTEHGYRRCPET